MAITAEEARAELARRRGQAAPRAQAPVSPGGEITPEQARAELARRRTRPQRARQPNTAEDVGRSLVTGAQEGVAYLAGLPRDVQDLFGRGLDAAANALMRRMGRSSEDVAEAQRRVDEFRRRRLINLPGGETLMGLIESVAGPRHEPQTTAGEYARTIGQFATGAVAPGGIVARGARVIVPAAASETAGQVTEGTPLEVPARIAAGIGGGIATELGVAGLAGRATRTAPQSEAARLEQRIAPMTRGERSGNPQQRLTEDDWRRGIGSDQAQQTLLTFDARRAPAIRESMTRVASRGLEPLSDDAGEAGTILSDALRSQIDEMRSTQGQLYQRAFDLAKNERVAPTDELMANVENVIAEHFLDAPKARAIIGRLNAEILAGRATYGTVERARQALNRELGAALKARNDADAFAVGSIIDELDAFAAPRISQEAGRAIADARGFTREMLDAFGRRQRTDLATGHVGRADPGGAAVERIVETDMTGEQVIDAILGTGRRPPAAALGAVRRIRERALNAIQYTNRNSPHGERLPGREKIGGQTAGERRFAADSPDARYGVEQPKEELQALREAFVHRLAQPLDDYIGRVNMGRNEGGILPAQTLVTNLDNALNGKGREITRLLFTQRELDDLQDILRYLNRLVPPPGANYSGTTPALTRALGGLANRILSFAAPGVWPLLREAAIEGAASTGARRAIARPSGPPKAPRPPSTPEQRQGRASFYGAEGAASALAANAATEEPQ